MKEIIYIQAGSLANHTGTHFWNTQESYFTHDSDSDAVALHDVSFREGSSLTGRSTFCPRLLIFDRNANFGTLAENNALGTNEEALPDVDSPGLWHGDVMEFRQDPIPKSTYQSRIDESDDPEPIDRSNDAEGAQATEDFRYWSDFNRVYYVPRTVQKIPDLSEWDSQDGDWKMGQELFSRYNEETALMEGPVRLFLEECDFLQGIQVMNDSASFGSFINSFLTSFRDEYAKLPCLVFPLLSDAVSRDIDIDDYQSTRRVINDALYLRGLDELSSMSVPIQSPSVWRSDSWERSLKSDSNSMYHNSAILSAHIETSTLPLRLQGTHEDLASLSAQLNWRGTAPFGQLSGLFPAINDLDFERELVNFSASRLENGSRQFTRWDVTRGLSPSELSAYDRWSTHLPLPDSFISRVHASAYPIPTSYPSFFNIPNTIRSPGILARPSTTHLFSSISTTSGTTHLFSVYATSIETCLKRKVAVETMAVDADELKELVNDLWTLHDSFDDGGESQRPEFDEQNSLGEDEE